MIFYDLKNVSSPDICLQKKMDCKTRNFKLRCAIGSLRHYFTISQTRLKNAYSEANNIKIL